MALKKTSKKTKPVSRRKPVTKRATRQQDTPLAVATPPQELVAATATRGRAPTISLLEEGMSGIGEFSGFIQEAYNAQLFWPEVQSTYDRLRRAMPEMVMVRQFFTILSRGVEPLVDLPEDPTDDDKEYRDFLLSEFDNMEGGFRTFLETAVNHVPFFGWGRWEAVPGLRDPNWDPPGDDDWRSEEDDGRWGIRRLAWRDTSTFAGWEFNKNKRMIGMWQRVGVGSKVFLANDKCLHLTFGDANNPEGLSPLEAVWRMERIRFGYEVIMGIGFEHAAGYLNVNKTEGGTISATDEMNIARAAKNILAAKEGNYAAWPPGIDGKVQDIPFQAAGSLLNAIQHYDILSLAVYLMQFAAFNTLSGTGSFAATKDASQITVNAFNGMMDGLASQYDRQLGRRLWDWNKDDFPMATKRPTIRFSHVQKEVELGALGSFLAQIQNILPLDEKDYVAIRKRTDFLPESNPTNPLNQVNKPAANPFDPNTMQPQEQPVPDGERASQLKDVLEQALQMTSREGMG